MFGTLLLVATLYFIVPVQQDPVGGMVLRAGVTALLLVALAGVVIVRVRNAVVDTEGSVDGLITAIALVWVAFALGFYILHLHRPEELAGLETRVDALYFTASTMLTVGYGDVHATGQIARGMVLVQMMFDVAFVATAGAVLSARVRSRAARRAADRGDARARLPRRPRAGRGRLHGGREPPRPG